MNVTELIAELSDPRVYAHDVETVETRQTHISVVFLAGEWVYKIRKAVKLPFLDFSSLEQRRADCEREVELNRRLAPYIYLGTVPITARAGRLEMEGSGVVVEWAVKMRRLPDTATLKHRLLQNDLGVETMNLLGGRLAEFHLRPSSGPHIVAFARFDAVRRNVMDNFQWESNEKDAHSRRVSLERLVELTRQRLETLRPLIEWRAEHGVPRDTHGDLRLDHVYLFPDRTPPDDLCIIDCIEFNDGFRFADPVSDIAFLIMDLKFHGRRDLARTLIEAYFDATADTKGRQLLPLYVSYRAAVRAKVNSLTATDPEIPQDDRQLAADHARAHWMLALSELQDPQSRPCLIVVSGLPGTGKTTLARRLAADAKCHVIRTDIVRKELAGIPELSPGGAAVRSGIYSDSWTRRTYTECVNRTMALLQQGERVLVDGTFSCEEHRLQFLDAANRVAVPFLLLNCQADSQLIRQRLAARRGDASDADWRIYLAVAENWEPAGKVTSRYTRMIDTDQYERATILATDVLRAEELLDPLTTVQHQSRCSSTLVD